MSQKTAFLHSFFLNTLRLTLLQERSVCRKTGLFQASLEQKRFSPSKQRVTLNFTWIYSKQRFRLLPARLCSFQQFLRRGFSFLSYQNCIFDLLSYRNHLLVWFQLNWKLRALCHKKQQFSFATKHAFKSFMGRKIYFGLFGVKLGSLQRY